MATHTTSPVEAEQIAAAERLGVQVGAALTHVGDALATDDVAFVGTRKEFFDASVEVAVDGVHLLVHDAGAPEVTIQLLVPCRSCGTQLRTGRIVTDRTTLLTEQYLAGQDAPSGLGRLLADVVGCRH